MAQIKISQLEELTSVSDNDVFASVDTANSKTKKTKASTLKKYVKENLNYSEVAGKPSINGTELLGDKSLQDLGIQPAGDYALNSALKSYSLVTETGNKISLTINSSTYVMTLQLKDKNSNVLSTGTIDLPLETMVVGASYNADTQEIELTLKNGSKVSFSVSDLVKGLVNEDDLNDTLQNYALKTSIPTKLSQLTEDSTHRLVTDTEKATWNNKVDKVSGKGLSTNDFTNELKTKLDGIEDNAQVNKIEKISLDGVEQEIVEKEVNIKSYDINKYFYNALTYNQAKGNDLTFEDSIEFPLGKLDMEGKSEQVTTTGIQLIDKTKAVSNDSSIILLEQITNGIKLTSLIETSGYRYAAIPLDNVDNLLGKKFYFSCKSNNSNKTLIGAKLFWYTTYDTDLIVSIPDLKGNFTIPEVKPEGVTKIRLCLYLSNGATNVPKGTSVEYTDILLKEGTEEAEYEPYTGGQPSPSPDYPQEINSIKGDLEYSCKNGVNNIAIELGGINSENGSLTQNNNRVRTTDYIEYTNLDIVNVQKGLEQVNVHFYDKDKKWLGSVNAWNNLPYKFNAINNTKYIKLLFRNTDDLTINLENVNNVKLYRERTLTIPTNGQVFRKVGDVTDKLVVDMKTGDYYKEKNIEEYEYNGSSDSNIGSTGLVASTIGEDLLAGVFDIKNVLPKIENKPISNKFSTKVLGSESDNENKNNVRFFEGIAKASLNNYQFVISIKKSRLNTADLDGFIQYFSNNPIKIQCALEKPTLEKLGTLTKEQLDTLVTFKGYNNVMINTNLGQADIDVEYVLDMKKYIDDKIAEISAQMI